MVGYGSRSVWQSDIPTGTAMLTPEQARKVEAHIINAIGSRKCDHSSATVTIDGDAVTLDCEACDIRATADKETATRLGWIL